MAQLIQMRQRIKAIDTIKKVTHAMRLISMSTHSHLKNKERSLYAYTQAIKELFQQIKSQAPHWTNTIIEPTPLQTKKNLIILIGSQKGLCGSFNTTLFKLFELHHTQLQQENSFYIPIGKKAVEFMQAKKENSHETVTILDSFSEFSSSGITLLSTTITDHIMREQYTQVLFVSNIIKTFFIQKPRILSLIPFHPLNNMNDEKMVASSAIEYSWEQEPHAILDILIAQYIEACVHEILFQSLLAEQAARFISMDSSTRNAEKLLDTTKLQYNKLRQTKITREISELASSF